MGGRYRKYLWWGVRAVAHGRCTSVAWRTLNQRWLSENREPSSASLQNPAVAEPSPQAGQQQLGRHLISSQRCTSAQHQHACTRQGGSQTANGVDALLQVPSSKDMYWRYVLKLTRCHTSALTCYRDVQRGKATITHRVQPLLLQNSQGTQHLRGPPVGCSRRVQAHTRKHNPHGFITACRQSTRSQHPGALPASYRGAVELCKKSR